MTLRKGLPAKLALTDADDTRYDFRNLVVCNSDGTPRAGVTSPVGEDLLVATSTMNVQVKVFNANANRDDGVVLLSNDGVTNVLLDQPPSSQSRLDVVWAKQNDSSNTVASADSDSLPTFGVLKGEASAAPVRNPAGLPDGAVEIGTVIVPSTATATNSADVVITTTSPYTAAPGGTVPFRTWSDMNSWTAGEGSPQIGQHAYVFADSATAKNGEYVFDGSDWIVGGSVIGAIVASPTQTLTTTATPISGLSKTVTVDAVLLRIRATVLLNNANSGADRTATLQLYEDATAIGVARVFAVPLIGSGSATPGILTVGRTPAAGSHTYTVKASASIASAVIVLDCDIDVTVQR